MSDNNDILEFLVQCLLNNRMDKTEMKNINRSKNCYIINSSTVTTLVKKNIYCAIQKHIMNENLDSSYINYEIENTNTI